MRGLVIALASFLLMVGLFAGLSRYSAHAHRVNAARPLPVTGPVLVRVPDIAVGSQVSSVNTEDVPELEARVRGWVSPEVVPVSQDGGLFRRLRSDLD